MRSTEILLPSVTPGGTVGKEKEMVLNDSSVDEESVNRKLNLLGFTTAPYFRYRGNTSKGRSRVDDC
jgi:hypothetical protein